MADEQAEPEKPKRKRILTPEQKEKRKAYLERTRDQRNARSREYYRENKERLLRLQSEYAKEHREQVNATNRKWASRNKEQVAAKNREWQEKNKAYVLAKAKEYNARDDVRERKRDWVICKRYGIDLEFFDSMVASQEGKCKCCNTAFGLLRGSRPCVDHCHETGRVRGILCLRCNWLLGHAHDQPEVLRNCAAYLERESGQTDGVVSLKPKNQRKKRGDDNEDGCVQRDLFSDSRNGEGGTHGEVQAG